MNSYPINTSIITNSSNHSGQMRNETRHLVVHSTDDPGATAQNLHDYWCNNNANANTHGAIDPTQVLLLLPLVEKSWSVGEPANDFTLNFELCMPPAHDPAYFASLWSIATWYFAKLCHDYGKDSSWIKSHDEIRRMYGGTDHTDPVEYFAEYGKTVDDFRADVAHYLEQMNQPIPAVPFPPAAAQECEIWLGEFYQVAGADQQKAAHWLADQYRVARGALVADAACKDTSFSADAAHAVITDLQAKYQANANTDQHAAEKWGADKLRVLKGIQ